MVLLLKHYSSNILLFISNKVMEQQNILIEPETLNKSNKLKSSISDEEREACLSSIPKHLCDDNEVSPHYKFHNSTTIILNKICIIVLPKFLSEYHISLGNIDDII